MLDFQNKFSEGTSKQELLSLYNLNPESKNNFDAEMMRESYRIVLLRDDPGISNPDDQESG